MGGSRSKQSSTSVQQIDPIQRGFLSDLYGRAQMDVANRPLSFFPGSTVTPQDPATLEAYDAALRRGRTGNAAIQDASGYTRDVLQGRYLEPGSNPYLRGTFDNAADAVTERFNRAVMPGIESRFGRAGQSMSGQLMGARRVAQDELGDDLRRLATDIYSREYDLERGRQDTARAFAPQLAAQDYTDIAAISGVGASREGFSQQLLDDMIARFEFAQNEPTLRLQEYANLLGQPVITGSSRSSGRSGSLDLGSLFG